MEHPEIGVPMAWMASLESVVMLVSLVEMERKESQE